MQGVLRNNGPRSGTGGGERAARARVSAECAGVRAAAGGGIIGQGGKYKLV